MLTATALVATVGDAGAFESGREFAAFVGLVPRQSGTGGVVRLGAISKRGDPYLRTLLIHGARAAVFAGKDKRSPGRIAIAEAAVQRGRRDNGKQDGAYAMGNTCSWASVRPRLHQRHRVAIAQVLVLDAKRLRKSIDE